MRFVSPDALAGLMLLVPGIPLFGAAVSGLFGRALGRDNVNLVACGTVAASLVVSVLVFLALVGGEAEIAQASWTWMQVGDLDLVVRLVADRLTAVMLLVITGIGLLIHVYSTGYMAHDEGYWRYFAYLNLFVAMMLILVLGDSLPVLFVGWEGVGLCSYLLIGFWYDDTDKAIAGKKAFIVNRVGDFGFLLGMFTLFAVFGTLNISEMNTVASTVSADMVIPQASLFGGWTYGALLAFALGMIFLGCTGKSAQIPLFVWLPDAMAGPTPVSALIHAATMVTAGVYVLARLSPLFVMAPSILALVAIVGVATALAGAFMALFQRGIKKVLAYSTVSQLGYMFVGVGVGAFSAGVYHLFTHAFFKACLFLCAGSVMHALANEEDIHRMGGLKKAMPHTHKTFWIATAAITGVVPVFSGFFSKDTILHEALVRDLGFGPVLPWVLWSVGTLAALFTAIYMWRLYYLVFEGEPRAAELHDHAHESPASMTVPLWILAIGAAVVGVFGAPHLLTGSIHVLHDLHFETWLSPVVAGNAVARAFEAPEWIFLLVAFALALAGWWTARSIWGKRGPVGDALVRGRLGAVYQASIETLWWDRAYHVLIVRPLVAFARGLWWIVDVVLIDRILVEGSAKSIRALARLVRPLQNGDAQRYAAMVALGAALVLGLLVGARAVAEADAPVAAASEVAR